MFDSTCAGGSWKATKVGKTSSKIKIIFLITIFDAGQVWLKNTRRTESSLSLIIITRDILWYDWKSHFQRHRRQRYFWFHISHFIQIPTRGLQRKVSDFYYRFLKINFHGNWKVSFIESKKNAAHCSSGEILHK